MSSDFAQTEYDAFEMDDVDPDAPGIGSGAKLPEGGFCATITEVILQNKRLSTEVKCEVVNAADANLLGRTHTEFLSWPSGEYSDIRNRICKEQLLAWCYAAKTTAPEEIRARQQARQGFDTKWLDTMVGRQVLMVIKHDSYQDASGNQKMSAKAEGRVWSLDNPKGKGIPGWVDAEQAGQAGQPAASGQQQQAASPAQQSSDDSAFSDLV